MTDQQQARALTGEDLHQQAQTVLREMRAAVASGEQHWFLALAEAIRLWPLSVEQVGERTYRYLIAGEAFDWLLLAERLCGELDHLAPEEEIDQLVFHGRMPEEVDTEDLQQLLGAKYRAHLNFVYGVRVETALQLAVQEEVHKEHLSRVWENGHVDDEVYRGIYGSTRLEMLGRFCGGDAPPTDQLSLAELSEFTYWLFRNRVNNSDPARVASDTRKGLAYLQRLEALRRRGGALGGG